MWRGTEAVGIFIADTSCVYYSNYPRDNQDRRMLKRNFALWFAERAGAWLAGAMFGTGFLARWLGIPGTTLVEWNLESNWACVTRERYEQRYYPIFAPLKSVRLTIGD